jgi:hypothetical protein
VFLEVRDAAARILENTTLADLISRGPAAGSRRQTGDRKSGQRKSINRKTAKKKKGELSMLPMLARGEGA